MRFFYGSHRTAVTVLLASFVLPSCDWINPDETQPSYISIESYNLTTSYITEGSANHKITDAWIYIDDQVVGAFELPARFPVLEKGNHTITVYPGIKMNGIAATRIIYPFFTPQSFQVNLEDMSTTSLSPVTQYASFTNFAWMEDFESPGSTFSETAKSDTIMLKVNGPDAFEGSGSGRIFLDSGKTVYEGATTNAFKLPKSGKPVFLEMHYRNNHPFVVGLFANGTQTIIQVPLFSFNPSPGWNKIYINLTQEIGNQNQAIDFTIFIGVFRNDSYGVNPEVFLDNLKLIH